MCVIFHLQDEENMVEFWHALNRLSYTTSVDPNMPHVVDYSSPIQGDFPIRPLAFMLTPEMRRAYNAEWQAKQCKWLVVNDKERIRLKEKNPEFEGYGLCPCMN